LIENVGSKEVVAPLQAQSKPSNLFCIAGELLNDCTTGTRYLPSLDPLGDPIGEEMCTIGLCYARLRTGTRSLKVGRSGTQQNT
jgi:hypothetical protein